MTRYIGVATDDMDSNVLRQQLASQDLTGSGAGRIGYDGETVEQALDKAKAFPSYAELRAYSGMAEVIHITNPGIEGFFQEVGSVSPVDNAGTMIVDAAGRLWQRIFNGPVSAMWFGAVGDGAANDTIAIQAALDSGAKVVRLPARKASSGLYKITQSLRFKFGGQQIVGDGIAGTTLIAATGSQDGLICQGLSSCGISFLKLAGSGNTAGELINVYDSTGFNANDIRIESGFNGITFNRVNNCKVERFVIADLTGQHGVLFSGDTTFKSDVVNLINGQISHFSNSSIYAVHWQSYAHSMSLENVRIIRGGRGLFCENSSGVSAANSYPSFLQMVACEFDFQQLECLRLDCMQDAWVANLYAHGSFAESNIFISDQCKGVRLSIPRSASAFKHGLYSAARAFEIIGGEFWSNSQASSGTYDGIRIGATARGVKVMGVISGDADNDSASRQGYGLNIEAGASRLQYIGNGFEGNVTGTVNSQNDQSYEVGGSYRHSWKNMNGTHFEVGGSTPGVVNSIRAVGSSAGAQVQLLAQGSDANVDFQLSPKGTGNVRFGSLTASADAPITGYIIIKDAGGTQRKIAVIT